MGSIEWVRIMILGDISKGGKMAAKICRVDYFYIEAPNKPGEGAKLLAALHEAGVDLLAFSGFPLGQKAQIDFVPKDSAVFKAAAKKIGLKLSARKTGFLVQGEDRAGAIAGIGGKLPQININVTAMDAVCAGKGRYGAILWVKSADIAKAAKALHAS
jgi:hypothetical protein